MGPEGIAYAENLDFQIQEEGWSIYDLPDGTVLKARIIATKISRGLDEQNEVLYNRDGEPIYNLRYRVVVTAEVPGNVMREAAGEGND